MYLSCWLKVSANETMRIHTPIHRNRRSEWDGDCLYKQRVVKKYEFSLFLNIWLPRRHFLFSLSRKTPHFLCWAIVSHTLMKLYGNVLELPLEYVKTDLRLSACWSYGGFLPNLSLIGWFRVSSIKKVYEACEIYYLQVMHQFSRLPIFTVPLTEII